MTNEQIEAVGGVNDVVRAAYEQGFHDGFNAARAVLEVFAGDERQSGGIYSASAMLQALDKARAKAAEMMGRPPVVRRVPVVPGTSAVN